MSSTIEEVSDAEFEARVLRSPCPVVLDVFAAWCAPCRAGLPFLEKAATRTKGKVSFLKYDADQSEFYRSGLGVMSLPTLIVFRDGVELWRARDLRPSTIEKALYYALDGIHSEAEDASELQGREAAALALLEKKIINSPDNASLSDYLSFSHSESSYFPSFIKLIVRECLERLPLPEARRMLVNTFLPDLREKASNLSAIMQNYYIWALCDPNWGIANFSRDSSDLRACIMEMAHDANIRANVAADYSDISSTLMRLQETDLPSTLTAAKAALSVLVVGFERGLPEFIEQALLLPENYRQEDIMARPEVRAHQNEIARLVTELESSGNEETDRNFFEKKRDIFVKASDELRKTYPDALKPSGPLSHLTVTELRCAVIKAHMQAILQIANATVGDNKEQTQ